MRWITIVLLTCAATYGQDIPEVWVTKDAQGQLVFSYWQQNADGSFQSVPVTDIRFIERFGPTAENPTDPPPNPGNPRLTRLEASVRSLVAQTGDTSTASAIGVVLQKVANGVRAGTVQPGTLRQSLKATLDLMLNGRDAWLPLKGIVQTAIDNLQQDVGASPSAEQYAATIDAIIRGLDQSGQVSTLADMLVPGVDETTTMRSAEAVAPAIDWAMWIPIILAILRLLFPDLGF